VSNVDILSYVSTNISVAIFRVDVPPIRIFTVHSPPAYSVPKGDVIMLAAEDEPSGI
jgi:hypothetical protein